MRRFALAASRRIFIILQPKFQVAAKGIIERRALNSQGQNSF